MKRLKICNIDSKKDFEEELKKYKPVDYYYNDINSTTYAFVLFKGNYEACCLINAINDKKFNKINNENLKIKFSFFQTFDLENLKLNKKENTYMNDDEFNNYLNQNDLQYDNDLGDYDEDFLEERKNKLKKLKKYLSNEEDNNILNTDKLQVNNYYIKNVQYINQNIYYN